MGTRFSGFKRKPKFLVNGKWKSLEENPSKYCPIGSKWRNNTTHDIILVDSITSYADAKGETWQVKGWLRDYGFVLACSESFRNEWTIVER